MDYNIGARKDAGDFDEDLAPGAHASGCGEYGVSGHGKKAGWTNEHGQTEELDEPTKASCRHCYCRDAVDAV